MTRAIQAGVAEVQSSELALLEATDEEVRGFAERMVQDHTEENRQLFRLAEAAGALF